MQRFARCTALVLGVLAIGVLAADLWSARQLLGLEERLRAEARAASDRPAAEPGGASCAHGEWLRDAAMHPGARNVSTGLPDAAGVVLRLLDAAAARRGGTLRGERLAACISEKALEALGRLAVTTSWDRAAALELLGEIGRREARLPSLVAGVRAERLALARWARKWHATASLAGRLQGSLVALRLEEALASLETTDPERQRLEWRRREGPVQGLRPAALEYGITVPDLLAARADFARMAARFRLARTALELEYAWASSQSLYPLDPDRIDRPHDPFGPGTPLRYEPAPDGLGYRLWSLGPDGMDQSGAAGSDDLVLERLSETTRAALIR